MTLVWILGSVLVVSLISLIGIIGLLLNTAVLKKILFLLVSLAAGALFGDAIFHLIPEVFESEVAPILLSSALLAGILGFFALEKFLRWHHAHGEDEFSPTHHEIHPVGYLVIVGDGLHNFIDGLVIGTAYLVSVEIGIATTLAIILHEIPQEVGDFGLLLHAGFSRVHALVANFFSALLAFFGAGLAFVLHATDPVFMPILMSFAAGSFLYIAGSDLVPELQKTVETRKSVLQFICVLLGVVLMAALLFLE